jgi:hypothetical protein
MLENNKMTKRCGRTNKSDKLSLVLPNRLHRIEYRFWWENWDFTIFEFQLHKEEVVADVFDLVE